MRNEKIYRENLYVFNQTVSTVTTRTVRIKAPTEIAARRLLDRGRGQIANEKSQRPTILSSHLKEVIGVPGHTRVEKQVQRIFEDMCEQFESSSSSEEIVEDGDTDHAQQHIEQIPAISDVLPANTQSDELSDW